MAMRPSRRATLSPAQTWAPEPKARCRLGSRAIFSRSGSENSAGSRLAAPMPIVTNVPAAIATPPSSTHEAIDQLGDRGLHVGDGARCEGPGDDPAHPGVQGRVIEDKARRVVLVEQALAIFGRELALLVGGEGGGVLVEGHAIGIARDEKPPSGKRCTGECSRSA